MARYFVKLAYDGTNYHGWQIQKNAASVQQLLNTAFSTVLRADIRLTGAGRTDTGVHAWQYYAHFDIDRELDEKRRTKLLFNLNGLLPPDIVVQKIFPVRVDANARFTAISRTYQYVITRVKDPFLKGYSHYLYGPVDVKAMNAAARMILEYRDFTSFSKVDTDTKTNNCKVTHAFWIEKDTLLIFTITADRFLRNMVRAIVGTLLDVGTGKIAPGEIRTIIESKNRSNAGDSVPACGLFLAQIEYPDDIVNP